MARKKVRRNIVPALLAFVCLAIVAGVVIFYVGGNDSDDDRDGLWAEGDFVEWATYYYEAGGSPGDPAGYQRFTVTEVDGDRMTVNRTWYDQAMIRIYSDEVKVSANVTAIGLTALSLQTSGYDVVLIGPDTVATGWGTLSAEHHRYGFSRLGVNYTVDVWTRNGFILMETTSEQGGGLMTVILTDTNISKIYAP